MHGSGSLLSQSMMDARRKATKMFLRSALKAHRAMPGRRGRDERVRRGRWIWEGMDRAARAAPGGPDGEAVAGS